MVMHKPGKLSNRPPKGYDSKTWAQVDVSNGQIDPCRGEVLKKISLLRILNPKLISISRTLQNYSRAWYHASHLRLQADLDAVLGAAYSVSMWLRLCWGLGFKGFS